MDVNPEIQETPRQESYNQVVTEKKKVNVLAIILGILFLASLAFAAWLFLENQNLRSDKKALKSDNISKQNQIINLMKEKDSVKTEPVVKETDKDLLVKTEKSYNQAQVPSVNYNVEVAKLEGDFARVDVTGPAGTNGYPCFYKKSNSQWLRIYCGHGGFENLDKQYAIPATIKK